MCFHAKHRVDETCSGLFESTSVFPSFTFFYSQAKASGLIDGLLKYETIATAHVFLRIFAVTTRLSKHLQTKGIDLLTVKRLIASSEVDLNGEMRRDFESIKSATDGFVAWARNVIDTTDFGDGQKTLLHVQTEFLKKRLNPNPLGSFKIDVFNVIMDTCITSFQRRFNPEAQGMLADLTLLEPQGFSNLVTSGVPKQSLGHLTAALKTINPDVTKAVLQDELLDLAKHWDVIKLGRLEDYQEDESEDAESEDESEFVGAVGSDEHQKKCRNCPGCVLLLLTEYNMLTNTFKYIGLGYKYLLTLSVTQVACERSFSALKTIKTYLRSRLSQENLEGFMMMKLDYELVFGIENDFIIDKVANHSSSYGRILKL